ncbi:MAG: hypothetical protein ACFFCW_23465 [Candidatus Hodarchaeota archaeon]
MSAWEIIVVRVGEGARVCCRFLYARGLGLYVGEGGVERVGNNTYK